MTSPGTGRVSVSLTVYVGSAAVSSTGVSSAGAFTSCGSASVLAETSGTVPCAWPAETALSGSSSTGTDVSGVGRGVDAAEDALLSLPVGSKNPETVSYVLHAAMPMAVRHTASAR